MVKKIVSLAVLILLCAGALFFIPGILSAGQPAAPEKIGESSLTFEEIAITAKETNAAWTPAKAHYITLSGDRIGYAANGATLSEDGRILTITAGGTYVLRGELHDGQIVVNVRRGNVHLVMDGARIAYADGSPLMILSGDVRLSCEAGTENSFTDGTRYPETEPGTDKPYHAATIWASDDLVLCGSGSLQVTGNTRDAIFCRDRLVISDLSLSVQAAEDGVIGREALLLRHAQIRAVCGRDGLKATAWEEGLGYLYILDSRLDITAGMDGISSADRMLVASGDISVVSGGGSAGKGNDAESQKGLKAAVELVVADGTLRVDAYEDALHSDGRLCVTGGAFALYCGDDGLRAEHISVLGGTVQVFACRTGLRARYIDIEDGWLAVDASGSGLYAGEKKVRPGEPVLILPKTDKETDVETPPPYLHVRGGIVYVTALGNAARVTDGEMTVDGGLTVLCGPWQKKKDPVSAATFSVRGGTLVALGQAGYTPRLPASGAPPLIELRFSSPCTESEWLSIADGEGRALLSIRTVTPYYHAAIYSSELEIGQRYRIYRGGTPRDIGGFPVVDTSGILPEGARSIGFVLLDSEYAALDARPFVYP